MMRFSKNDSRTLLAFIDQDSADSRKLTTDGKRLDGNWMGGRDIAHWRDDKIWFGSGRPHGRADQTVIRAIVKNTPKAHLGGPT